MLKDSLGILVSSIKDSLGCFGILQDSLGCLKILWVFWDPPLKILKDALGFFMILEDA